MSTDLGALSSYTLAVQQMQVSLIKNAVDMQKQMVETLFEDNRVVPSSSTVGQNVDTCI